MNADLVKYIEQNILPAYDAFTDGHDRSHVEMAIRESLYLARLHSANEDMAYTVAAYHDLGIPQGRKTHHLTSAVILESDGQLRRWFTPEQIHIMKEAVEDHRASAGTAPRTLYGSIIADADHFIVPEEIIHRTLLWGKVNFPHMTDDEHIVRARGHMYEKFCEDGYLRFHLNNPRSLEGLRALRELVADEECFDAVCRKYL